MRLCLGLFVACVVYSVSGQSTCVGPDRSPGKCVPINECPPFLALLRQRPLPPQTFIYLQQTTCENPDGLRSNKNPKVCCVEPSSPSSTTTSTTPRPFPSTTILSLPSDPLLLHPNLNLLPKSNECGASSGSIRVVGGKDASLGSHPWMARLGYITAESNEIEYGCGGTLINDRYVLTAAHCLKNLPTRARLIKVRLGEHRVSTKIDCEGQICAPQHTDYFAAEFVHHPNYNTPIAGNDIGIIRLETPANFTEYVKPICLPVSPALRSKNYVDANALVSGWGRTDFLDSSNGSDILQEVMLPIVSNEICGGFFEGIAKITDDLICAGGHVGKDSCAGDSGGPLIVADFVRYVQIGIVSFGQKRCGVSNVPGVYTRVGSHLKWILDSLKP